MAELPQLPETAKQEIRTALQEALKVAHWTLVGMGLDTAVYGVNLFTGEIVQREAPEPAPGSD